MKLDKLKNMRNNQVPLAQIHKKLDPWPTQERIVKKTKQQQPSCLGNCTCNDCAHSRWLRES
jgi:hypothetical protein